MAKAKQTRAYKDWKIEDIIAWCQANGQVDWLKTVAAKQVKRPVYPTVENISKTGKRTKKQDKSAEPIGYVESAITFVELKKEFIETFFEVKEKESKPSMYDIIKNL
jgi:hypothetical protein